MGLKYEINVMVQRYQRNFLSLSKCSRPSRVIRQFCALFAKGTEASDAQKRTLDNVLPEEIGTVSELLFSPFVFSPLFVNAMFLARGVTSHEPGPYPTIEYRHNRGRQAGHLTYVVPTWTQEEEVNRTAPFAVDRVSPIYANTWDRVLRCFFRRCSFDNRKCRGISVEKEVEKYEQAK